MNSNTRYLLILAAATLVMLTAYTGLVPVESLLSAITSLLSLLIGVAFLRKRKTLLARKEQGGRTARRLRFSRTKAVVAFVNAAIWPVGLLAARSLPIDSVDLLIAQGVGITLVCGLAIGLMMEEPLRTEE